MTVVTDPSSVNTESAGVEDAESSQGGKPAQLEPGNNLTAEEEALLRRPPNDPLLVTLLPNQAPETDDDPTEPLCGLSCLPPGT